MNPLRSGSTGILLIIVLAFTLCPVMSYGQVSVTTQHNDNWRTGQNTSETVLTTSNVAGPPLRFW